MTYALFLAAALAAPAPEAELAAKLPDLFARAAAHYTALDAAAVAEAKRKAENDDACVPYSFDPKTQKLDVRPVVGLSAGCFPGSLWLLYEATGDARLKDRATAWTDRFAPNVQVVGYHDVAMNVLCSYGNARRLLKTDKYDGLLVEMAATLCRRYDKDLGLVRSWGPLDDPSGFLVVPDGVMTLELLALADGVARRDGTARPTVDFGAIIRSHADATMRHLFLPDGGCHHIVAFDPKTTCVQTVWRGQGVSCTTAWSCGQSRSIYGYTVMYRTTKDVRYRDFAKKLADYAINHPNMPADGIPYWDYGAPGEERDSAAAAIMASALLELSQYVDVADRARYCAFAVKQLLALSSREYFSEGDEAGHFLLKHGVGNRPGGTEIDVPLAYGDYYYLEALLRFRARTAAAPAKTITIEPRDGRNGK